MRSRLQIEAARHYGRLEFVVGFFLHSCASMVPFSVPIVTLLFAETTSAPPGFSIPVILLGYFVMFALFLMFMPVFQVNPFIQAVIERTLGLKKRKSVVYDCQITFSPRLNRGLRRLLDDADDVGRLEITSEGVTFHGGCVTLALPFRDIESSKKMRAKARNLWIAGGSTRLMTSAFDGITSIEFGERQSRSSWNSKRISAEIAHAIECGMQRESAERAEP